MDWHLLARVLSRSHFELSGFTTFVFVCSFEFFCFLVASSCHGIDMNLCIILCISQFCSPSKSILIAMVVVCLPKQFH